MAAMSTSYHGQIESRNFVGNANASDGGTVNINFHHLGQQCLADLMVTNPRHDKKRIEQAKGGLLDESYRWILQSPEFHKWRDDPEMRLLWIKGDPGKGKTMLLCGIIDEFNKGRTGSCILSYFFCQGTDQRLNNATAVLRGLLYLLLDQQPTLISHIKKEYGQAGKRIFEDVNAWVALSKILADILQDPTLKNTYLIIDALDECISDMDPLLSLIAQNFLASPRVKWIVSSRNWPRIELGLRISDSIGGISLSLEDNAGFMSQAIDAYISYKLSQLEATKHNTVLRDQVHRQMREKANGTFLWIALVFNELKDMDDASYDDDSDVLKILEEVPNDLTNLYSQMLQQINGLKQLDPERCRKVLSTMALAYRPLHLRELATLAGFKGNLTKAPFLEKLVKKCGSFLTVRDETVYFIHQSAKDHLMEDEKARSTIFRAGLKDVHYTIFSHSLQAMANTLQKDIYELQHPGTLINEIRTPNPDPLAAIRYSCVHWVDHLCKGYTDSNGTLHQNDFADSGPVSLFLQKHFLHWLETLGLLQHMPDGVISIRSLESLIRAQVPKGQLLSLLQDAHRFILHNRQVIENAPLQTYSSALIFTPTQSLMRVIFEQEIPSWIKNRPIIENNWSPCLQTLEGHRDVVTSVAISPDGQQVASASHDRTIKIWNTATGICLLTLKGHSGWVRSTTFLPNGQQIISGSNDKTIKIWNTATGACLQTLEGHQNAVESITLINDQLVASGSRDNTIKIWNIATGICLQTLKGHSSAVASVAFSANGQQVASASYDMTIKIWNTATGICLQTLKGHSDWVRSVNFSVNDQQLASGSDDKTIKIWNTATGACLQTLKGHQHDVTSITLINDQLIASGSCDNTIKIWNIATGACLQTLKHGGPVTSIDFFAKGQQIISASDDSTMKIWNIAIDANLQTLESHKVRIASMVVSANSQQLASGSWDKTIKIWKIATGTCLQTLKGHSSVVASVAFSANGQQVASASYDRTIKIWDISTGACLQTLEGHSDRVTSVTFSANDQQLASGSWDNTIKIWKIATGTCLQTLKGHSSVVASSHFLGK